jgi:hypothetical protein
MRALDIPQRIEIMTDTNKVQFDIIYIMRISDEPNPERFAVQFRPKSAI